MCAYNLDTFNPTTAWSKRRSNHNDRERERDGRERGGYAFALSCRRQPETP